jgi:hypothetical protein
MGVAIKGSKYIGIDCIFLVVSLELLKHRASVLSSFSKLASQPKDKYLVSLLSCELEKQWGDETAAKSFVITLVEEVLVARG